MSLKGTVSSTPLTWGTAGTLYTFFTLKNTDKEISIKCDFLCYVRVGDFVLLEGEFREEQPWISNYKIEGKYFEAKKTENQTLNLKFKRP